MNGLRDKVVVITGGGGAIASAVAQEYHEAGARVVLVDVDASRVQGLAGSFGSPLVQADLRDPAEAERMLAEIRTRVGRIDGLVHMVGDAAHGRVVDLDHAAFDLTFDSNVRTLFNAVKVVLPVFLEQGGGFLAGIASHGAWLGSEAGASLFAASKSAVEAFLRSLDRELEETQVGVTIVFPMGPVDTATNRRRFRGAGGRGLIAPAAIATALVRSHAWQQGGRLLELPIYPPRR